MPNQPSKNIKRLVVPVPVEVAQRLAVLAAMERRSISNYLQGVVLDHLEQMPVDQSEKVVQMMKDKFGETAYDSKVLN